MKALQVIVFIAAAMLMASAVTAMNHTPEDRGKVLFNDPKLGGGTAGRSCNTCHPDGKGLVGVGGKAMWKTPGGEVQDPRRGGEHLHYHGAQGKGPRCQVRPDERHRVLPEVTQGVRSRRPGKETSCGLLNAMYS